MKDRKIAKRELADHSPKKKMKPKGSISMSGPEKLLGIVRAARGAAKKTSSRRIRHKKTVY
jgi:hypothetical protein